MSLERRLILPVFLALLASLLVGATLSYQQAVTKVRVELQAALAVGRRIAQHQVDDAAPRANPLAFLQTIVGEFDGDRHLRMVLADPAGRLIGQSSPLAPLHPAPQAVLGLIGQPPLRAAITLPATLAPAGQLSISTDSRNEIAEAWSDLQLILFLMAVVFCLILGLTIVTLRKSLMPLKDLSGAFARIGAQDYEARLDWPNYRELETIQTGLHAMARHLAETEAQNRLLATRMQCLQEDERAELARDLHDDVAPFLFAVSADAALIRQFAAARNLEPIEARAGGILTSVGHMQKHLRGVLSRLMPDVLLDLGLPGAVDSLVHFWASRKPDITFVHTITEQKLDPSRAAIAFRVVQESLSNAIRHAQASRIDITVTAGPDGLRVEIADNGRGLPGKSVPYGLGVIGMRERVRALGGSFAVEDRPTGAGVIVAAILPAPDPALDRALATPAAAAA